MKQKVYQDDIKEEILPKVIDILLAQNENVSSSSASIGTAKSVFADAGKPASDHVRLNLDITCFKVPYKEHQPRNRPMHPTINRVRLPHTLTDGETNVLLVTKDYPKPGNPSMSNAHYHELLTLSNCAHLVTEVMSLSQLRAEYSEPEAQRHLSERVDVVLCDSSLALNLPRLLGKSFLRANKFPISIKMSASSLEGQIKRALSTTTHKMTFKNTQSSMRIGRPWHTREQLVENLSMALQYLSDPKNAFPGGWPNVRTLYLTMGYTCRIPLYVSTKSKECVPNLEVKEREQEVLEGDFGFGHVKMLEGGWVIDYIPESDDEEPVVKHNPWSKKRARDLAKEEARKVLENGKVRAPKRKFESSTNDRWRKRSKLVKQVKAIKKKSTTATKNVK